MQQEELPKAPKHPEKNKFHLDLPFEVYQQAAGINATGLKEIVKSPAHFQVYLNQEAKPETDALRFGRLAHIAVLEPSRFKFCSVVQPAFNLRTVAGREDVAKWRADQEPTAIIITESEAPRLQAMVAAVDGHPMLKKLLAQGHREVSLWWDDEKTGVLCKGRLDFISAQGVVVDLKTTRDVRPEAFSRDVAQNMYSLQAAHYLNAGIATKLFDGTRFLYVAAEKEPPFSLALYMAGPSVLDIGAQWRNYAMVRYAECLKEGRWPGLPQKATMLEMPGWAPLPPVS